MVPCNCPSCKGQLNVKSLYCPQCGTEVTGSYSLPPIMLLSIEEQNFITSFVCHSGSLKKMAAQMKLSYPTVRNFLNEIIAKIEKYETDV